MRLCPHCLTKKNPLTSRNALFTEVQGYVLVYVTSSDVHKIRIFLLRTIPIFQKGIACPISQKPHWCGHDHFITSRCSPSILTSCVMPTIIATLHPAEDSSEFSSAHTLFN